MLFHFITKLEFNKELRNRLNNKKTAKKENKYMNFIKAFRN